MPELSAQDLMDFLRTRRSYRRFTQEPVPPQALRDALEAARIASCTANGQALKYIVAASPQMVQRILPLVRWAALLPPQERAPAPDQCPTAFIAVLQDGRLPGVDDTNAGLALGSLTAAAWAHGVGSCVMGAIDRPALCALLGVPEGVRLHSMVALGRPAHRSLLEPMQNGDTRYTCDAAGDFHVPKRAMEDILLAWL